MAGGLTLSRCRPYLWLVLFALLVVTACTPQATPFPVDIPDTPTPTLPPDESVPPLRYALASNTAGYVSDLAQIESVAQVTRLSEPLDPGQLGTQYDIIAAYGIYAGATQSPVTLRVSLVINPAVTPLDNPTLLDALRQSITPQDLADSLAIPGMEVNQVVPNDAREIRNELANVGYPDGFAVSLGAQPIPGGEVVAAQFSIIGVNTRISPTPEDNLMAALEDERVHAALIVWRTQEERLAWAARFGESNILDLYTLPISYWSLPGLIITFTKDGWPIVSR